MFRREGKSEPGYAGGTTNVPTSGKMRRDLLRKTDVEYLLHPLNNFVIPSFIWEYITPSDHNEVNG
jgi:hypothetical protein